MNAASSSPLWDTHTHLCDPLFDADRREVISRAKEQGITTIISVSENAADVKRNLELAALHPELKVAAGLFPTVLDEARAEEVIDLITQQASHLVAIGEVGLDYWKVKTEADRTVQRRIFQRFIETALSTELPLNVHSRAAGRDCIAMLTAAGARKVQLHAFDGRASTAKPAVDAGYFFSIPPSIVRSRQKQKLVRHLPLSQLLPETDSPVLGADPRRRNEPMHISLVVEKIAEIKKCSPTTVRAVLSENCLKLYGQKGASQ